MHFINAIFCCNPVAFLPQVIFATMKGLVWVLIKEFTGKLYRAIGMHIGGNTLGWSQYIKASCDRILDRKISALNY